MTFNNQFYFYYLLQIRLFDDMTKAKYLKVQ